MALTNYFVDPAINADSGTGTSGDPFGDLQYGLNTVTRDATNGDQFNIKAGTAEVLAATLTLATYGTPAESAPLVFRGYTSAANDGGTAEINCNGFGLWTSSIYMQVYYNNLRIHSFGDNNGVVHANGAAYMVNCEIDKGASTPSAKTLILGVTCHRCYIHDAGTNGSGAQYSNLHNCFVSNCVYGTQWCASVMGNLVLMTANGTGIECGTDGTTVISNAIYSSVANTGVGINISSAAGVTRGTVLNNLIVGFSGAGGRGIAATSDVAIAGYNAFYNNTTNKSLARSLIFDLSGDVTLAANPFTDAANGDFSLTDAAKTALRSLGWPASYLGAHANSDRHITIGAMQYGPTPGASGGGRRPRIRTHGV